MPSTGALQVAGSEPPKPHLVSAAIALRHRIAVLKQPDSSPLFQPMGSLFLDLATLVVAKLARELRNRSAGDGFALAARCLPQLTARSARPYFPHFWCDKHSSSRAM